MNRLSLYLIAIFSTLSAIEGLSIEPSKKVTNVPSTTRRSILTKLAPFGIAATATAASPLTFPANAQSDAQFVEVGQQEKPPNGESPFSTLPDGIQIKDFRPGAGGGPSVQSGSKVELTMKGRLLNLNGVVFYDTKSNDPNGFGEGTPLVFTVGDGTVLPGLERGIVGMSRGGIRRVIVPAEVGYGKFPGLEPQPLTQTEKRALDSVVKNPRRDQTVMFDVKVERVR